MSELMRKIDSEVLTFIDDFLGNYYLRPGKKEGQDFKVVDEEVWNILHKKYGGKEVRR